MRNYRAWDITRQVYHTVWAMAWSDEGDEPFSHEEVQIRYKGEWLWLQKDEYILEQQTDQQDKHGVEIYYDSDIVEYTYYIDNDVERSEETVTGTVVLDLKHTNSLCVKTKGGSTYHFTASELRNVEIIGNIHQEAKP